MMWRCDILAFFVLTLGLVFADSQPKLYALKLYVKALKEYNQNLSCMALKAIALKEYCTIKIL